MQVAGDGIMQSVEDCEAVDEQSKLGRRVLPAAQCEQLGRLALPATGQSESDHRKSTLLHRFLVVSRCNSVKRRSRKPHVALQHTYPDFQNV